MNKDFKVDDVIDILLRHPNLRIAFKAGLISRRLCKDMLGITKWEMDDLYVDLIRSGAIRVLSSSAFRATEDTLNVIASLDSEDALKARKEFNDGN